ncbi:MAG: biotin synthase BioB [Deltaproteobacteria bacterium]|nr:biotin synthase BioB [Deltaproteobacteria bacterium]
MKKVEILKKSLEKGLAGDGLTVSEAIEFSRLPDEDIYEILAVTERVRRRHKGVEVNLCSIVNAKSGLCKEDCSFCSQSVKYSTGINEYPMAASENLVKAAIDAEANGAGEFSIVTSGTKIEKERDLETLAEALSAMKESVGMERCASLGILAKEALTRLKNSGLESYHHNLETGRSFFPNICTTHKYDDDVEVVKTAKELGFYVCSGGIFGLGEAWEDRIELGATLKELDVDSVPVNFLNPRPGTPLEGARNLTPVECLKIIALLRVMMPKKDIVICGGRNVNLRDLQPLIFAAGANGMMIGNYLTTPGRNPGEDRRMIADLGLKPRAHSH